MALELFINYRDYIISAGRICLEIANVITSVLTVQTLIWINALEANLDDENNDVLRFLGVKNKYKDLLWSVKVMLIIHSIITFLKLVTTCCILIRMCWNINRKKIYETLAKYKYRHHMILPTTQETNLSNLPSSQDQSILQDAHISQAPIVHAAEDRRNTRNRNVKSLKEIDCMI